MHVQSKVTWRFHFSSRELAQKWFDWAEYLQKRALDNCVSLKSTNSKTISS
jgi:hypothetical protein